jgi:phage terminase large subunit
LRAKQYLCAAPAVWCRLVDWAPGDEIKPGHVHVFVMDWRDHPLKDQEWYDLRRAKAEREGLLHVFRQEVDRDYSASVEGILIPREWIDAAIDAHKKIGFEGDGVNIAALDVADEGGDLNALSIRTGSIIRSVDVWGQGDVGQSAQRAISAARLAKCDYLFYDSIGVGAGVKSEANRMMRDGIIKRKDIEIIGWNAASKPLYPNGRVIPGDKTLPKNREFFKNLKAQGWWKLRKRFENTFNLMHNDVECSTDELISISSELKHIHELVIELSQIQYTPNSNGQITIDKKPPGTKSPNSADSVMMNFWPVFNRKVRI